MSPKIDPRTLSQLAFYDAEVQRHRSAIEAGRRREAALAKERIEIAAGTHGKRDRLQALQAENRRIEAEIEDFKEQSKRHNNRLNDAQDTREYNALNDEIRYLRRQIENREEQVLANMELIEKAEAEYEAAKAEFEGREKEIQQLIELIHAERDQHEKAMAKAAADLEQFLTQVDEATVRFYRRRAQRQDQPVVWMEKGACGFCHSKLTPQGQIEAQGFKALVTCTTCGRLVVGPLTQDSTVS